jgi:predicted GNAT family acetyltransferase
MQQITPGFLFCWTIAHLQSINPPFGRFKSNPIRVCFIVLARTAYYDYNPDTVIINHPRIADNHRSNQSSGSQNTDN